MPLRRWTRDARLTFAMRNPLGGFSRVPAAPALTLRDLWPGDPLVGERLVRNQSLFEGVVRNLQHLQWDNPAWPEAYRRWLQGFTWLRDLRELGAESARIKARSMVATWIGQPASERPITDPSVTGARLAAWLSYYEFFAAAADDHFRQNLMAALIMEARSIMALMPEGARGWRALTALKGLLAVAVAIPDHPEFLSRYLKLIDQEIDQQFLADGSHITRCPEDQFQAVRELAEMLSILQTARLPLPTRLMEVADRAAPALRAMRHGDGGLMLFNGSRERDPQLIEQVLNRASRGRVVAASQPESGYIRLTSGRTMLFADAAGPAPAGYDSTAHAGMLSFEFSSGRQRIIVNCGASAQRGWSEALRVPAAHSVLEMGSLSPITRNQSGTITRRPTVTRAQASQDGSHWLHMTHDGYKPQGGGVYSRQLYLGKDGQTLRGAEALEGTESRDFCVRFHLHPDITVEEIEHGFLLYTHEESWLFQANVAAYLEDSVYLGSGERVDSLQIVLCPPEAPEPPEERAAAAEGEEAQDPEADGADHTAAHAQGDAYPEDNAAYPADHADSATEQDAFYGQPHAATEHEAYQPEHGGYAEQDGSAAYSDHTYAHTDAHGYAQEGEAYTSAPQDSEEDAFSPLLHDAPPADSMPYQAASTTGLSHTDHSEHAPQETPSMAEALFAGQDAAADHASQTEGPTDHGASAQASESAASSKPAEAAPPAPAMRPVRWALTLMTE
ncbi:Heparinase II/III-like [Acetobacter malorum]|nr:Heparinase II/III-like [Acetobacter malorum]